MSATPIETIPTTWDDSRDGAFFRITAGLFSGDFCFGAGVLLATPRRRRHHDAHRQPAPPGVRGPAPPGELRTGRSGGEREEDRVVVRGAAAYEWAPALRWT